MIKKRRRENMRKDDVKRNKREGLTSKKCYKKTELKGKIEENFFKET